VLFTGLFLSHFGITADAEVLSFVKDFGLILFVFAIGMQVGPGFFHSFKKGGMGMNLMALVMVLLAGTLAFVIHKISGERLDYMVGVMSGAVTNTPGLGAAEQTLSEVLMTDEDISAHTAALAGANLASAYAVAYPIGVIGVIALLMFFKTLFKVDVEAETAALRKREEEDAGKTRRMHCKVTNPSIFGRTVNDLQKICNDTFLISRLQRNGEIFAPKSDTTIEEGDLVLLVTKEDNVDNALKIFGEEVRLTRSDWDKKSNAVQAKRLSVSRSALTGRKIKSFHLRSEYGVSITRVIRAGVEIMATPSLELQMGDDIIVVGSEEGIESVSKMVGNKPSDLAHPNLIPIFIGIALGVLVGMIPVRFPNIPQPIKLGLAGGPLIVAILLGYFGPRMHITTYSTQSANAMLREIGIDLFLAAVGLSSGANFVAALTGGGWWWILYGAIITLVPVLIVGLISHYVLKLNFFQICGLITGSCTNPPALAFAQGQYGAQYISTNYATVYPLSMFLRVLVAQLLILLAFV